MVSRDINFQLLIRRQIMDLWYAVLLVSSGKRKRSMIISVNLGRVKYRARDTNSDTSVLLTIFPK